jgi:hypothetical protein
MAPPPPPPPPATANNQELQVLVNKWRAYGDEKKLQCEKLQTEKESMQTEIAGLRAELATAEASKRARVEGAGEGGGQQPGLPQQVLIETGVLESLSRLVNLGPEVITPESLKDLATFLNNYAGPDQNIPLNTPTNTLHAFTGSHLLAMVHLLNSGVEIIRPMFQTSDEDGNPTKNRQRADQQPALRIMKSAQFLFDQNRVQIIPAYGTFNGGNKIINQCLVSWPKETAGRKSWTKAVKISRIAPEPMNESDPDWSNGAKNTEKIGSLKELAMAAKTSSRVINQISRLEGSPTATPVKEVPGRNGGEPYAWVIENNFKNPSFEVKANPVNFEVTGHPDVLFMVNARRWIIHKGTERMKAIMYSSHDEQKQKGFWDANHPYSPHCPDKDFYHGLTNEKSGESESEPDANVTAVEWGKTYPPTSGGDGEYPVSMVAPKKKTIEELGEFLDADNGSATLTLTHTGSLHDLDEFISDVNTSHLDKYAAQEFKKPAAKETAKHVKALESFLAAMEMNFRTVQIVHSGGHLEHLARACGAPLPGSVQTVTLPSYPTDLRTFKVLLALLINTEVTTPMMKNMIAAVYELKEASLFDG